MSWDFTNPVRIGPTGDFANIFMTMGNISVKYAISSRFRGLLFRCSVFPGKCYFHLAYLPIKSRRHTNFQTQKSDAHFLINCVIEKFLACILKIQIAINLLPISEINFKNV